jgi:predicted nucleic acid-binding protein
MSLVFWDTNLFIYYLEDRTPLADRVQAVRERMLQRKDQLVTSCLTLGEVLVKPKREQRPDLVTAYEHILTENARLIPLDRGAAAIYATIRHDRQVKAPDAIQLACAASAGVDLFITNDDRLSRMVVPGIQFITSLARAFL